MLLKIKDSRALCNLSLFVLNQTKSKMVILLKILSFNVKSMIFIATGPQAYKFIRFGISGASIQMVETSLLQSSRIWIQNAFYQKK